MKKGHNQWHLRYVGRMRRVWIFLGLSRVPVSGRFAGRYAREGSGKKYPLP